MKQFMRLKRLPIFLVAAVLAWLAVTYLLVPLGAVLHRVFISNGSFSLDVVKRLIASDRVRRALGNSFVTAFCTILTVNLVGLFQVAVTEFFDIKFARGLRLAFFTPLIYSSIALVTGYNFVYGSRGALTQLLLRLFPDMNPRWFMGFAAVLVVHSFSMTSFHIIFVRNAVRRIDNSTIEAARALGADSFRIFTRIAIPILKPAIYAATLLLFLGALGSHAAPFILGGRDFEMINSLIQVLNSIRRLDMAALLSLLLGSASFALLLVFRAFEKRGHYTSLSTAPASFTKLKIRNPGMNALVHGLSYLLFVIYTAPVILVILFSFAPSKIILTQVIPTEFTLGNYIDVLTNPVYFRPLRNSIVLSFSSALASVSIALVSVVIIRKSGSRFAVLLELALFIPWIVPVSMLAMGLISAFSTPSILLANKVLLGSFWILPIGYTISRLPFAVRMLSAAILGINTNLEEAARSLGAGIFYTYRKVIIPLLMPTILSISALTFNILLSEYTLSALLYNINNKPLGIALSEGAMDGSPERTARTLVYVVILMAVSLTTILTTNHLNIKRTERSLQCSLP